jgi:hypothetical protein
MEKYMSLGTYFSLMGMVEQAFHDGRRAGQEAAGRMQERRARKARLLELEHLQKRVLEGKHVDLRSEAERQSDAGWDEAASQAARADFLLNYLAKLVPDHTLLHDKRLLDAVGDVGVEHFKRGGRKTLNDACVSSRSQGADIPNDWARWGVSRQKR